MRRINFDELFEIETNVDPEDYSSCKHDYRQLEAYYTCILCGRCDVTRLVIYEKIKLVNRNNLHLYHRKIYFSEKMRLLTGQKQSENIGYSNMIKFLKNEKFDTIIELKKIMKKNNFNKFYKYIYSIYTDIKNVKLINLTYANVNFLCSKFLLTEREFKKIYPKRKNILSYNIIIYTLLKKYNFPCYKYIILPRNNKKIIENISELLKNY